MKKQLLLVTALFSALSLFAQKQLPNPGFEEWEENTDDPNMEDPVSWLAPSDCEGPCEFFYEKVNDGHTGLALKLKAKQSDPNEVQPLMLIEEDFAAKPAKVTFWYKSSCSLRFGIIMSAGPIFTEDEISVGEGVGTLPASTGYVKGEVPIAYSDDKAPEHLLLVFALAKGGLVSTDFAVIDDVQLVYDLTSIDNPLLKEAIQGNVVSTNLELRSVMDEIQVFNTSGILMVKEQNTNLANLEHLPEGLYVVSLRKGNAYGTLKVLKK